MFRCKGRADAYREIAHLPPAERAEVAEAAQRRASNRPSFWVAVGLCAVSGVLTPVIAALAIGRLLSPRVTTVVGVVAYAAVILGAVRLIRQSYRASLREELMARDIRPARCFVCGYDLTGTDSPVCTECGIPLAAPATAPGDQPT